MIKFILNNTEITTGLAPGMLLLDFVRYQQNLKGTKIGCREGDCGACTVLLGELQDDTVKYITTTSCLTPLGNINNKHVVTVEGLNMASLNPIQQAICEQGGTQCGFCTPGFIVSMAGYCLSDLEPTQKNAVSAVDGNICRCTGYKSIERALAKLNLLLAGKTGQDASAFVTEKAILPSYFKGITERLKLLQTNSIEQPTKPDARFTGGGTDLYVQQHQAMVDADIDFLASKQELQGIWQHGDQCIIGGATTVTEFACCPIIQKAFTGLAEYIELVSSTPIRNIATLAGNFVNASPIGDFSIFFLALNAQLELTAGKNTRHIPLRQFYKGYKQLDLQPQEFISKLSFRLLNAHTLFNFEKVSKRTHLDIASVNSAITLQVQGHTLIEASISAGGVGPVPMFLAKASAFLGGKTVTEELVLETIRIAQTEVSPISDARGTDVYKRLLLGQLIKAHFIKFFPSLQVDKLLNMAVS